MSAHSELESMILDYLVYCGWYAWPTHGPRNRPAVEGMPDILAVRNGQLLAVEVKVPPDNLTGKQRDVISELREHEVVVCVARSLEDVKEVT